MGGDAPNRPGDYWSEVPEYPVSDWQAEVANDDTRQGYWEWVESKKESDEDNALTVAADEVRSQLRNDLEEADDGP